MPVRSQSVPRHCGPGFESDQALTRPLTTGKGCHDPPPPVSAAHPQERATRRIEDLVLAPGKRQGMAHRNGEVSSGRKSITNCR